ncbi:helix-turn-helix domain-containing protein [Dactylosporangium salmoneum]|uniref:HTH tetR-type domain-containing protein n=1 Tax=Dactylosporangium salmoneum TaxID=53361 RepID=A0ABP5SRC5_9ACTN
MAEHQSIFQRPQRGTRGPAPSHSREEIVEAAVALADADGLAAVSMRAVAARLGTAAGSLYRYLSSRDDLLELMSDAVVAELRPFPSAADPLDALVVLARAQLAMYQRHPWLTEAIQHASGLGPNSLAYFDHCLGAIAPLPCPVTAKFEAIAMLTGIVTLFARPQAGAGVFAGLDFTPYPNLIAAMTSAATDPAAPQARDLFERTIRAVMSGLLR